MKPEISFSTLEVVERRQIKRALRVTKGNLSQAARLLDIDRRTLYRKLEKYSKGHSGFITMDYVSSYPSIIPRNSEESQ